jgi:hypothetical protein
LLHDPPGQRGDLDLVAQLHFPDYAEVVSGSN